MAARPILVVVFLTGLLLAPAAHAQLTDTSNTLFANFGDAYYIALEQIESGATGNVGVTDETPQEQLMVLQPALSTPAELDPAGKVEILACFDTSASLSGVPVLLGGQITVATEVRQGSTIIATGEAQDVVLVPSMIGRATWSLTPAVTAIDPAAGDLEWYLHEGGAATGALFVPDCTDGTWSSVVLPVKAAASDGPSTNATSTSTNTTSTSASSSASNSASNTTTMSSSSTSRTQLTLDRSDSEPTTTPSNTTTADDQESPGAPVLASLGIVGLALLVVRRRLS